MTFQGVGRIGGIMRCPLVGRYVSKTGRSTGRGSTWSRAPLEEGSRLLDYYATFVEQGAAGNQQIDQVLAQADLVGDHLRFRLHFAILRVADIELKAGAELVLLVGSVQVLVGKLQRHLCQLDGLLTGLEVG